MRLRYLNAIFALLFWFPAHAFTLQHTSDLEGWGVSKLTFAVNYTDCSIPQEMLNSALDRALELWNGVPSSSIVLERGGTSTSRAADVRNVDEVNNVFTIKDSPVVLCSTDIETHANLSAGSSEVVPALAVPGATGNRMVYGPVVINTQSGKKANVANFDETKIAIILAHEIGHVLGLGHSGSPEALMYFNASEKEVLALSQDDMDGISYLYPRQEPFDGDFFGCGTMAHSKKNTYKNNHKNDWNNWSGLSGAFTQLAIWMVILFILTRRNPVGALFSSQP